MTELLFWTVLTWAMGVPEPAVMGVPLADVASAGAVVPVEVDVSAGAGRRCSVFQSHARMNIPPAPVNVPTMKFRRDSFSCCNARA